MQYIGPPPKVHKANLPPVFPSRSRYERALHPRHRWILRRALHIVCISFIFLFNPPLLVAGDFNSEATMTRIVPGLRNNARELQNNAQGDTGGTRTRVQHRPHITYVIHIHALSISRHDASHCCRASCHHPASQWHHASLFRFTLWQDTMPTACFTFTVASCRTPCRHYSSKLYTRGSCH